MDLDYKTKGHKNGPPNLKRTYPRTGHHAWQPKIINCPCSNVVMFHTGEAKVDGRVMIFDGTRPTNQIGSLLKHLTQPNFKPFLPVFVRGKYRIEFLELKDISKDTELTWDYNYRDPKWPWLYGMVNISQPLFQNIILSVKEEPADHKLTSTTALKKKVNNYTVTKMILLFQ